MEDRNEKNEGIDTFSPARKYPKSRRGPPVWLRAFALPAAEEVKAQCVQRSVRNEAACRQGAHRAPQTDPRTPQTAKEESGSAMCDIRDFKPLSPLESPSVENCERTHFLQSVLFRRRKKARRARLFSLLQKFAVPFAVLHAAGNPA